MSRQQGNEGHRDRARATLPNRPMPTQTPKLTGAEPPNIVPLTTQNTKRGTDWKEKSTTNPGPTSRHGTAGSTITLTSQSQCNRHKLVRHRDHYIVSFLVENMSQGHGGEGQTIMTG